jgi:hypothetical protein
VTRQTAKYGFDESLSCDIFGTMMRVTSFQPIMMRVTTVTVHVEQKLEPMRMSVYVVSRPTANHSREFRRMGR